MFNSSDLKAHLEQGLIQLPPPNQLPKSNCITLHFFIADPGFRMTDYLITPYSKLNSYTDMQLIFNYRLSRSRHIIECSYGLLVQKWNVFKVVPASSLLKN